MKLSEVVISLIKKHGGGKVVEVGVWKSDTTKKTLKACSGIIEEYWAVDMWEVMSEGHGKQSNRTIEHWQEMHYYCCRLMTYYHQLHVLKMESLHAANLFNDGYFDFMFLDSNHYYRHVLADIKMWLPKIRKGGVFAGHDYGNHWYGVKRAVDEIFGKSSIKTFDDHVWVKEL